MKLYHGLTKRFIQGSLSFLLLLFVVGLSLWRPGVALASGPVTNCLDTGAGSLRTLLTSGGTVTFNVDCPSSSSLKLNSTLSIGVNNTIIDGTGHTVVIDGQNLYRIFDANGKNLTLIGLTLTNGNVSGNGGAIYANSTVTVISSTIYGNTGNRGGGIYIDGKLNVINSTLSNNTAITNGGAIAVGFQVTVFITNSTIYNNKSSSDGAGINLINWDSPVTIANSIIGHNMVGVTIKNCYGGGGTGGFFSGGYNWIDNATNCGSIGTGTDTVATILGSIDPNLAPNSGTTPTHALFSTSSNAIDKISFASCPTTDQRGQPRTGTGTGSACDVGAYEFVLPTLSISSTTVTEGSPNAVFTVTLSRPISNTVTVNYTTAAVTATSGVDYTDKSGTLTFNSGITQQFITVPITDDLIDEDNETFNVTLSSPVSATLDSMFTAVGTIVDNDSPPVLSITAPPATSESAGQMVFTVTLSAVSGKTAIVNYATANGTAIAPGDYITNSGTLTFNLGETSKQITVTIIDQHIYKPSNKNFNVTLSSPINATGTPSAVGAIVYDASIPAVSINSVSQSEGTSPFNFDVSLSALYGESITVTYITQDDTANALIDNDYTSKSGSVVFAPGEQTKQIQITVIDDTQNESNQTFFVNLTSPLPAGVTLAQAKGTGTILNNDNVPDVGIHPASVTEGNSGTSAATFIIDLTGISPQDVTVQYKTANGTAEANSDYNATSGTATIPAGKTYTTINIPIIGDTLVENNETFTVTLSNPNVNATLSSVYSKTIGTIIDDDTPTLSINDVAKNEGYSGDTPFGFMVTLSPPSSQLVTVTYKTADGTTSAGSDYIAISGTLTFNPIETTKWITVSVKGEPMYEGNETFFVNLSNALPSNTVIAKAQGQGFIINDDVPPIITISNAPDVFEGLMADFVVTLSTAVTTPVKVDCATSDGTAIAGSDYSSVNKTLTFNPGQTQTVVTVLTSKDSVYDPNETFTLKLSNPLNAVIDLVDRGKATIIDTTGEPTISIDDQTVTEGLNKEAVFKVTLSGSSVATTTVIYGPVQEGQAKVGMDYEAKAGQLVFAPGVTWQLITVTINDDLENEPNETFYVNLDKAVNAILFRSQGVGTIKDNGDPLPELALNNIMVMEGDSDTTPATFKVTLTPASGKTVTINYATADVSAKGGDDYFAKSGVLTFLPGTTEQSLSISVKGDIGDELNELFMVNLTNPTNAVITTSQGIATILNDDAAVISIADKSIKEGDSGTKELTFDVTLSVPCDRLITVNYATANGTATAKRDDLKLLPADYIATSGILTFTPSITKQTINVTILGETRYEQDETFFINLSNPTNAMIAVNQAVGLIRNDDTTQPNLPTASINDGSILEGNFGTTEAIFSVVLTRPLDFTETITISYFTADNTAVHLPNDFDYQPVSGTLTFAAGITTQNIIVPVVGDIVDEEDEYFYLFLTENEQVVIAKDYGVGTILNDDISTISINDVMVKEGDPLQKAAIFTITLSVPNERLVSVEYKTIDGTATARQDYLAQQNILVFQPGTTSQAITVPILNDAFSERNETFSVNLSNASRAVLTHSTTSTLTGIGLATILDDDGPPTFYIAPEVTVTEGDSGTMPATFIVSLWPPSTLPVQVSYDTITPTGTSDTDSVGFDYQSISGTLIFTPGITQQSLNVPIIGDKVAEPTKTFWLKLSNAIQSTLGNNQGKGVIIDNDRAEMTLTPKVVIWEGAPESQTAIISVSLSVPSSEIVSVNYETGDETAKAGQDYTAVIGVLTFPPGSVVQTITVPIIDDKLIESTETFQLLLHDPKGCLLTSSAKSGITIFDGDGPPKVYISDAIVQSTRTTKVLFMVKVWPPSPSLVVVDYTTVDGTAKGGLDYVPISGTLTFYAGEQEQPLAVMLQNNSQIEPNGYFVVKLNEVSGAEIGNQLGTATIIGETAQGDLEIAINDGVVWEGETVLFNVTMSRPSTETVIINYVTTDNTAMAGADYVAANSSFAFSPGTTTQTIAIATISNLQVDGDKTFFLKLTKTTLGKITVGQAIGTILDRHVPIVSISNTEIIEGNSGTTAAIFEVWLSFRSSLTVSVNYTPVDGTAISGEDYISSSGMVLFPPGNLTQTISVLVLGDTKIEENETFLVNLITPTNAILTNRQGIGTIINDDTKSLSKTYLPLIIKENPLPTPTPTPTHTLAPSTLPDLVVKHVFANTKDVQVTIENIGGQDVTIDQPFWIDFYVNPTVPPTAVNQGWSERSSEGIVWYIDESALPLKPGDKIILEYSLHPNSPNKYAEPQLTHFTGVLTANVPIYAQVDSSNPNTTYGVVLEEHEKEGKPYNNITEGVSSH